MRGRLTSSRFVGRVGELAELELALGEAATQRPVLVLLSGESGVGKTRLVAEFEQRMAGRGTVVLRGEGVEQSEGELPYAPLLGALRPLVRERHPALAGLSPGARAQLAALIPGLADGPVPDQRHDAASQLRLFEALLELLDCLGEDESVVLILEDVHWADSSTRTFISFLARSLRQERLMLLVTYRTDELHRRHALRPLLAELERLERARRIHLDPFDRDELAEALADILGEQPSPQLVERLYLRSEGNALFSEELLAAGLDGRGAAPQSLRDAFMLRIERLSPDAQTAARAIAVGRSLDEPLIAELTGIEHDRLHTALREAVSEQVLTADNGSDRLCFRHALLREALYDDLLPGERSELHLALARALEAQLNGAHDRRAQVTAAIAGHYASAGDQPAALRATVRAALAASDVHAYGETAELAERALELWPRVPGAERDLSLDHVDLLRIAAGASSIAGDRGRAEVLLRSAIAELDPAADPRRRSALLSRLARIQWTLNRGAQGLETAQEALALLPEDDDSSERAGLIAWLARTQHLRGRYRDALRDGKEALAAATAARDRYSEGEVLNTLGMTHVVLGNVDEGVAELRRAVAIAQEMNDLESAGYAYANLADTLSLAGRTRDALAVAQEGLAATPRRLTRNHDWMMLTISELAFELGDWETARTHLVPEPSQVAGTELIFRLLREAEVCLGTGDAELAALRLEQAEPLVASSPEPQWIGLLGALLGELRRRQRDLPAARAAVAQALDRIELCTDDVMRIARVTAVGARIEADFAQRARDLREKAAERDAIARARIHEQRLRAAAADGGPVERAWQAVGAAELARARGRHNPSLWNKAAADWESMARPFLAALARWRAAEAYVEAGDREAATSAGREALEVARRVGSGWLVHEVTLLGERARLDLGSASGERGDDAASSIAAVVSVSEGTEADPFGLTPRERQVLALIAEGATNRQIGAALYMAEKTASVHVSRILSKLGVRSRTQAAAVAHRLDLTGVGR